MSSLNSALGEKIVVDRNKENMRMQKEIYRAGEILVTVEKKHSCVFLFTRMQNSSYQMCGSFFLHQLVLCNTIWVS